MHTASATYTPAASAEGRGVSWNTECQRASKRVTAIRTVEDLRQRCVIDDWSDCWIWSLATKGRHARVRIIHPQTGKLMHMCGRRAAATLQRGNVRNGWIAFAKYECKHDHCVNPDHVRVARRDDHGEYLRVTGKSRSERKTQHAREIRGLGSVQKLTPEQVEEIRLGSESTVKLAAKFGVAQSTVWRVRKGISYSSGRLKPGASVFSWKGD